MTITVKVVADSISPDGIRLTTMQLRYPKFIHGEFMTHRVFSRNASSSRAIPVEKMIEDVLRDPAIPSFWGKNQPGMSAAEEWDAGIRIRVPGMPGYAADLRSRKEVWLMARDQAVEVAQEYARAGYHKQIVNRLIEPWCHINVVVTATESANFFALRCHPGAQPEMRILAEAMRRTMTGSLPAILKPGEWHLPYVDRESDVAALKRGRWAFISYPPLADGLMTGGLIRLSVARCARVSYLTHEGKPPNVEEDLKLYDRLVGSEPLHASPAEHQATPDEDNDDLGGRWWNWKHLHEHGNFVGWRQFRKTLPDENVRDR